MCACAVDIREIREVREGTDSKDFEKQQVELKKIDQFCFIIYYTSEFKVKTLSVAGVCACACVGVWYGGASEGDSAAGVWRELLRWCGESTV